MDMMVPSWRRRTLVMALGLALCGSRLAAQNDSSRVDTLSTIVVSATRSSTTLRQMALHTTVITQEQIAASPAQTLDQLLRMTPGVNMPGAPYYTTDPTGHQTRLRGVTNSKVLMLLDGVPLHDPFYSTTQWFKIPLSDVERVEVVRGGGSSLWGNLAVAGVVNVITRRPLGTRTQGEISYQSFDTWNVALSQDFKAGSALVVRLSGNALSTDGYQTTPATSLGAVPGKSASGADSWNARVEAYFTPSADLSGFARIGYHRQNEDIGGYRFGSNLQREPDFALGLTRRLGAASRAEVRAWGQWESFDKENGAACYLQSASSCNTTATSSPLVQFANSRDWNPYRELGASAAVSTVFSRFPASLQAGLDFRRIAGEDTAVTYNGPTTTDGSVTTVNRVSYGQGAQQFLGGFAQLRWFPVNGLEVTANLRYDSWINQNGKAVLIRYSNGVAGTPSGGSIANTSKRSFNPSLSLRYSPSEAWSLRGAAYTAFRAPGLNNLYRSYSSTTSITLANPHLSPETLTGGEVGADLTLRRLALGLTLFQYGTKHLIASYKIQDSTTAPSDVIAVCGSSLSNCPSNVNFNTNGQDARSRGVELTGRWDPAASVGIEASYTYTDSRYTATTTGDPINVQLGAIPSNAADLSVTLRPFAGTRVTGIMHYVGKMWLDVKHTIGQPAVGLIGVSAAYRWSERLELRGSVSNLTNVAYCDNATTSVSGRILGLPRSWSGGLQWAL